MIMPMVVAILAMTLYAQFLVFCSYRFIMVIFVTVPLASFGLVGNIVSFITFGKLAHNNSISYTLSREYRVARYRYSRLLFTSEDRLCANLRVQ